MAKLQSGTRVYGNLTVDTTLTVSGNVTVNNITTSNLTVTNLTATSLTTVNIPLVLNNISNQTDGIKSVFPLRLEQANITSANITDSKNLSVVVSGRTLSPYVTPITYPWITVYNSYPGYRVVTSATSANVIIYTPPTVGSQVTLTITSNSSAAQTTRYPYSATTISLGD